MELRFRARGLGRWLRFRDNSQAPCCQGVLSLAMAPAPDRICFAHFRGSDPGMLLHLQIRLSIIVAPHLLLRRGKGFKTPTLSTEYVKLRTCTSAGVLPPPPHEAQQCPTSAPVPRPKLYVNMLCFPHARAPGTSAGGKASRSRVATCRCSHALTALGRVPFDAPGRSL